ncbi:hypothetical protein QAD02_017271 [Eretmocerus hayati]|uniref:Uncharacterized protein n=1 Tax=Eretmocerus hayati TaxID=131215 RepID=A0ACC2PG01_9HYME|nr:hypothetical protein QAD02_017271 [Eretmocerus hayati]
MEEQNSQWKIIIEQKEFYEDAAKYWDGIPPTIDGMLGGFGFISHTDIFGSKQFLRALLKNYHLATEREFALDCGAGIGRITKNLLSHFFKKVDLVDQNPKFLEQAKSYLKNSMDKVGNFYSVGLQDFCPESNKYDIIWCQWVLGHLNNDDLVKFFQNCRNGLRENGFIVVKENVTTSNEIVIDKEDSSLTRPRLELLNAFEKAKLKCIKEEKQFNMPDGLFPVLMFALTPCDHATSKVML